ncbi:MAG: nucleoside deaminase [Actinobacteria bacterium]|uniref:tRNA-specific adenosine deaminase 2 n=1 Tax=freshwater metagenome TaxID=449393 RepID=A0A6J6USR7_9ZZZZ|nr:nucleoside deaminase [Actinomycetota bacterium]
MTSVELMREAIAIAQQGLASNDVPVGALVIDPSGKIIATGTNEREAKSDPTAHAEIVAIRKAANNGWRLDNHTLVVTLEPCAMCAGAIAQARISKVIFGAWDTKAGAAGSVWDVLRDPRAIHRVEVESGVLEKECAALLSEFFRSGQ